LNIALELVLNLGTAHIGSVADALGVTAWVAEILVAGKGQNEERRKAHEQ